MTANLYTDGSDPAHDKISGFPNMFEAARREAANLFRCAFLFGSDDSKHYYRE